jgi:hypothetical protein
MRTTILAYVIAIVGLALIVAGARDSGAGGKKSKVYFRQT